MFDQHINNIKRSCFQHLKRISDDLKYITEDAAKQLVHAFITSRLDNGNYLLYDLPISTISHLLKIQNSAAKWITRTCKFDSITTVLQNLHCLLIEKKTIFKLNVGSIDFSRYAWNCYAISCRFIAYNVYSITDTAIVIQDLIGST